MNQAIYLRPFGCNDMNLFKEWLYKPHVSIWFEHSDRWIEEVENRHSEFDWIHHYIAEKDRKAIGFCQYYEYLNSGESWHGDIEVDETYSIDYMIGDASYLNQGYGKAIVSGLINLIRDLESAKRVIVQPEPENKPSCNTLLSCGFVFDEENKIYILEL